MKRGPKPKKPSLYGQQSIQPPAYDGCPPTWLDDYGREFWFTYAPRLTEAKLLTEIDVERFAMICDLYSKMRVCQEILSDPAVRDAGWRLPMKNQKTKEIVQWNKHPAFQTLLLLHERLVKEMDKFGMSPASRTSIKVPSDQTNPASDDLDLKLGT